MLTPKLDLKIGKLCFLFRNIHELKNSKLDKSENVSFTLFSISVNAGTNVIKICRLPAQKLAEAIVLAQLLVNHNFFPLMSTRISLLFHFDNV